MVDLGGEADFRRLEWIVRREGNGEEKDATGVGGITRSHDCRLPLEHIITSRSSRTGRWGITTEIDQFLVDALESHWYSDMLKMGDASAERLRTEEGSRWW